MSDQATSGEPNAAPATADAAPSAAPAPESKPTGAFGSFGAARGSGLARGKRAAPAPAAPAASSASSSGYKPSSVAVITSKSEYVNPFTGETTVSAPVNEPAPQAAPALPPVAQAPAPAQPAIAETVSAAPAPTAPAPAAPSTELFPFAPPAAAEPKPASPRLQPAATRPPADSPVEATAKAEIKILPPADVKRPAVSWGEPASGDQERPQRDQRPTFQPERREPRKFEPRSEPRAFEPREPRREPALEQRGPLPRGDRPAQRPEPARKSGGFIAWLKGLFGGKTAEPVPTQADYSGGQNREDGYGHQRRHRGGRGRGGYQGDNRGPREQPRDPRDEPQGEGDSYNRRGGDQPQGERRYEGGGGRRRRRGGRGRNRDDRGGPRSEGQQGGGAI